MITFLLVAYTLFSACHGKLFLFSHIHDRNMFLMWLWLCGLVFTFGDSPNYMQIYFKRLVKK